MMAGYLPEKPARIAFEEILDRGELIIGQDMDETKKKKKKFKFFRKTAVGTLKGDMKDGDGMQEIDVPCNSLLGEGGFSAAFKGITMKQGGDVYICIKAPNENKSHEKEKASFCKQASTQKAAFDVLQSAEEIHSHVIQFYFACEVTTGQELNGYTIVCEEYFDGKDIWKQITDKQQNNNKPFCDHCIVSVLQQMASAVDFMEKKAIRHLDIKPHNVLSIIDTEHRFFCKVVDFGYSVLVTERDGAQKCAKAGTLVYMSPEVLLEAKCSHTTDMWGVGIVSYAMVKLEHPWSDMRALSESDRITEISNQFHVRCDCHNMILELACKHKNGISGKIKHDEIHDCITSLLHHNDKERPDGAAILARTNMWMQRYDTCTCSRREGQDVSDSEEHFDLINVIPPVEMTPSPADLQSTIM